ncbi:MAG: restriction endonuclease subunit S [Gammaproteobacteria bacterium]|nr:restriction endonuclease subunit S [Gammaproteobacteria bacterium]
MRADWQIKNLSEVCQIKPPKKEAKELLSETDLVSFVPMTYLGIRQKELCLCEEKPLAKVVGSYTYFAENDVLLAKITPCFENGKLGIARGLRNGVGFGSSEYIVFRSKGNIDPEYLFYFLSQDSFRDEGAKVMTGAVGHKRVPKEFIEDQPIPLPSLAEQQRIVATLDEAFTGIATATANAEKNLQNARELFESYLDSIFTKQDKGWITNRLIDLTTKIGSGSTPRGGEKSYKSKGISLIRSLNVHDRRFTDRKLAFIDDEQAAKLSNVIVEKGDVLFNITGASVARCCIVPNEYLPARVNQHVSILRPRPELLSTSFLCYLMTSKIYKDKLLGIGDEGGSTRQAITKAQLQNLEITIPGDLKQQNEIVHQLDVLSVEVLRLELIYKQKLNELTNLKQSILKKAFAGELH